MFIPKMWKIMTNINIIQGRSVQASQLHPWPICCALARHPEPQHIQPTELPQRERSQKCLWGDTYVVRTSIDVAPVVAFNMLCYLKVGGGIGQWSYCCCCCWFSVVVLCFCCCYVVIGCSEASAGAFGFGCCQDTHLCLWLWELYFHLQGGLKSSFPNYCSMVEKLPPLPKVMRLMQLARFNKCIHLVFSPIFVISLFLVTLVALHFTPVSKWLARSFELA